MRLARAVLWTGLALIAGIQMAQALDERILDYHSDIEIHADASLTVSEQITVRSQQRNIRRGIYRDFPTRYRDRLGKRVVVDFEVIEVLRDGRPEPWFIEARANGVRINTGNDELLPGAGEYTFTIRYRTSRQLGFFRRSRRAVLERHRPGLGFCHRPGQRPRRAAGRGASRPADPAPLHRPG